METHSVIQFRAFIQHRGHGGEAGSHKTSRRQNCWVND